jgi:hypothetical protein
MMTGERVQTATEAEENDDEETMILPHWDTNLG